MAASIVSSVDAGVYDAKTFTLKNGLTFYLIENHRIPVVAHMVVYKVGSADDPRGKSGLAHYMEHMMFKGPKGSASEKIMADVQKVGGAINASTGYDMTHYYEIVPKDNLEHVMKLEADRMKALEALPEQAAPELKVVLEEENMRMGNNPIMQFLQVMNAAFYKHHPYGTMPIGWRSEIETYTPEDVVELHKRWYSPENAIIVLSGDLTLSEAKDLANKYYGHIPGKNIKPRVRVKEPKLTSIINVTHYSDKVTQPYVLVMLPVPSYDPKNPQISNAIEMVTDILSNGANGILYRKLVEDLRVATSFSIGYDAYSLDDTNLQIVAQAAPGVDIEKLKQVMHKELQAVIEKGISQELLDKFKVQTLSGLDYIKDSLLAGAGHLISPLVKGVPLEQIENWPDLVKDLKLEDVNRSLKQYFGHKYYVQGVLLPEKKPVMQEVSVSDYKGLTDNKGETKASEIDTSVAGKLELPTKSPSKPLTKSKSKVTQKQK